MLRLSVKPAPLAEHGSPAADLVVLEKLPIQSRNVKCEHHSVPSAVGGRPLPAIAGHVRVAVARAARVGAHIAATGGFFPRQKLGVRDQREFAEAIVGVAPAARLVNPRLQTTRHTSHFAR
jgi:hypothetical protein